MAENRSWGSLGDLLLREGLITDSQLSTALQVQKETEKSLGRVLVEMGLITERVRMRLLQQKLGYEIVQINPQRLDRMVLEYLPKSLVHKHRLVPVRLDLDTLVVAMEDPTDVTILDHLKSVAGLRIRPVIASVEEIEAVLGQYPEEAERVEAAVLMPIWARVLADLLLIALLAAPIVGFLIYVPTNPELLSRFARPGAYVDIFIFTLVFWGIYTVVVFEIWSLIFQRRKPRLPEPPSPPGSPP
ncbi:hypothetical protein AMJ85_06470 [candidate division BRC1 bacterium SM23_51]|nr:MAG: hypothetical protein AMJ85_06470 [candidate division BRC1 bacterium SM23_51]